MSKKIAEYFNKGLLTIALATVLSTQYFADARVLGNKAALHPVLRDLADPLHQKGIDVVAGDAAKIPLGNRPRVVPLQSLSLLRPENYASSPWMQDFLKGAAGVVAGAADDTGLATVNSGEDFLKVWASVPMDKRVFISFTKADVKFAEQIKATLESKGYKAFIFLNSAVGVPTYNATVAGTLFNEAGHHIVVDTVNARKSPGVFIEGTALAAMGISVGPAGPNTSSSIRSGSNGSSPTATVTNPNGPGPGKPGGSSSASNGFDEQAFVAGIRRGWIVTENPSIPGKIFIHRSVANGALVGLIYHVKVEGNTWVVYRPNGSGFGERLGAVARPAGVPIGTCTCL